MEICQQIVSVTTTGSAGSATGSSYSNAMHGFLLDIYLDWSASAPATSDVTISHEDSKYGNVLALTNVNTDALYAPRVKPVDTTGTAITDAHAYIPLNGRLLVSVAQCNALSPALTAYIRYLRVG